MTLLIDNGITEAADIIKSGGLVAVPTETVYGLAGNGLDEKAVERIYEVKGRPAIKPLSLMVPDKSAIGKYCEDVPDAAFALADKFWPGPLTIVLKSKDIVPDIVRAGGSTVGLRCPDHPKTLELLKLTGLPLAAPSANPSDMPSPKTAGEVMAYFDGSIEAVIDGGECGIGLESTLLDMSRTPYRILRQAALSEEDIAEALTDNMCILGITGPTGCGKTTVLKQLESFGALLLDCDSIYHQLLEEDKALISELDERFPGTVENGVLNRKKLGSIVFSDPEELAALNRISHAHIGAELGRRLRSFAMAGGKIAAIDAIELIGSGLSGLCDTVIGVLSDREKRAERIMKRDGIDKAAAYQRIDAQREDSYFIEKCDHILYNNGTQEEFCDLVINLLTEVL
ncbi:MAG: threonylcarbamoyl-AMP synthase [Oscillospiraceae bacterium]|nr:threonylcarbamoyl-AMP synthase [Oscillospiraceae bacterium]